MSRSLPQKNLSPTGRFSTNILVLVLLGICLFSVFFSLHCKGAAFGQDGQKVITGSNPEMASKNDRMISKTDQNHVNQLIREGTTRQTQHMIFRLGENRVTMVSAKEQESFLCLENLNLERIIKVVHDNPTLTDWDVDFIVTEYKGRNYALIQKATLTSTVRRR